MGQRWSSHTQGDQDLKDDPRFKKFEKAVKNLDKKLFITLAEVSLQITKLSTIKCPLQILKKSDQKEST